MVNNKKVMEWSKLLDCWNGKKLQNMFDGIKYET